MTTMSTRGQFFKGDHFKCFELITGRWTWCDVACMWTLDTGHWTWC